MTTLNSKIQILIIDDEPMWQMTTEQMCTDVIASLKLNTKEGESKYKFFFASTINEAKIILNEEKVHITLLDKDLGVDSENKKISGINHIQELKSVQPLTQIIVLTADTSNRDIAQAMINGASNYLFKTNDDSQREYRIEIIKRTITQYFDEFARTKSIQNIRKGLYQNYVCESPAMQRLEQKIIAVSESKRPILITGGTGLGKGALARRTSEQSAVIFDQPQREFVQLNIAATERNLVDSILFGTEPGAFTDAAKQTKAGLLDIARDGDIFLDEIGDASIELQLKLLKVVEEKEYYRVGGNKPIKTNARFIFATNKNLLDLIAQGKFREDLYMRISVFEIAMPALADRKEDIPLIVGGFLQSASDQFKNKKIDLADLPADLINYFKRDQIPGNIRGIENDVERLVAHSSYDSLGRAQLKDWKKTLGISSNTLARRGGLIGVEQLSKSKTNFLEKDFPGLFELNSILEKRILEEIKERDLGVRDAAKILKVSVNTLLARQKLYRAELDSRV